MKVFILQEELTKKLAHPFNLLASFSKIFIGDEDDDANLVQSGVDEMEEFIKIKNFGHVRKVLDLGKASLLAIKGEFNKAIDKYLEIAEGIESIGMEIDLSIRLMKCYQEMNENDKAISFGNEILIKHPYRATLLLGLAKAYHNDGNIDKCKELLAKTLNIWSDADEEYIYLQEAKSLWKKINKQ